LGQAIDKLNEHERRIVKLENKAETSDKLHGKAREDINEIFDRLNKMENNNHMKDIIGGGAMSDDSVDMILKAINDMQEKIKGEMDEKLKNYVMQPQLIDLENDMKANSRKIGYNEGVLKDQGQLIERNAEMMDNNRKKLARLQADVDNLRNN